MQWTRKIIIIGFALVIFTGSVGVDIFSHFCKKDGVDFSFILPSDVCQKEVKSCCHALEIAVSYKAEIKQNCCEEAVSSFRISENYIQKSIPELVFVLDGTLITETSCGEAKYIASEATKSIEITRPPPKKGKEILILHQVFRI